MVGVEFYRKKLGNGMTILFEKRNLPVVAVSASVRQGSAYEPENKKGISHFIEHLLFKGTKTRSYKQISEQIEKKGGVLNAFTGDEVTCCWNKLPSKYFSFGIDIVRDLILNPRFDAAEFEKEKKVILEEIKMYHDTPFLFVIDRIKSLLYKNPFGLSGLGTGKDILQLKRESIVSYFQKKYTANKMFLCVVGNTKLDEVEEYAKRFPETNSKADKLATLKINKNLIEKRTGLRQAHLALGFHMPSLHDKKRYSAEIFNIILAGGMSSRLFEEIREKRSLAYDVRGMLEQGSNFGYQIIYIGTIKKNVKLCKELILKEIKKLDKLERKDFGQAKEQLIGLRKVESEESINVMNALINEEITGDAREFYSYDKRISNVKLEDVRKLARINKHSSIFLIPS